MQNTLFYQIYKKRTGTQNNNPLKQINKVYLTLDQVITKIEKQKLYLIGICGIPGAGKSQISEELNNRLKNSIIIPMDGFHIYRKDLDEEGTRRRGAPFTFNLQLFKQKLLQLKKPSNFPIHFPSFDHAVKDPIQNDIEISQKIEHVIVEGLYIFDRSLQLDVENFWDLKLFIDQSQQTCLPRVIKRCVEKKIQDTEQKAIQRATKSDMLNGKYVLENTDYKNCYFIKNPDKTSQFKVSQ